MLNASVVLNATEAVKNKQALKVTASDDQGFFILTKSSRKGGDSHAGF